MNSNWFKAVMKATKVKYGKNLLQKGVPVIFNKGGAELTIGDWNSRFAGNCGVYTEEEDDRGWSVRSL